MPAPRTRRFHPVLLLVIIVILAAIGHVVLGGFMSPLWIAFTSGAPVRARTARQPPTPGETSCTRCSQNCSSRPMPRTCRLRRTGGACHNANLRIERLACSDRT
jgi:hypothetical protein